MATIQDALKTLGIEAYGERIFMSNSRGELFHLMDYLYMAERVKDVKQFKQDFDAVVEEAETTWGRPASVFQHIPSILVSKFPERYKEIFS